LVLVDAAGQDIEARIARFELLRLDDLACSTDRSPCAHLAEQHQQELETMRKTAAAARKNRQLPQEEKDRIDELSVLARRGGRLAHRFEFLLVLLGEERVRFAEQV
jgi:hypothetical protein